MKNYSTNNLAFISSFTISAVVFIILVVFNITTEIKLPYYLISIISISVLIVSFFLLRVFLFQFIYNRIRLIYKSIHTKKEQGLKVKEKFNPNIDLINQVDEDVTRWADEKSLEIQNLRKMEIYRKEFVGNVSHELKTPIFNIQGYSLSLLEGGLEDKRINRKYLKKIEKNINRMISIVDDLETISKFEAGRLELHFTKFAPEELIKEIIETVEDKATEKNIIIQIIKHYDKTKQVNADRHYISQVLINLIINAINYGENDGLIKVELFDMDKHLLVEITDNGRGISEEDMARVFERFYRVDKSHSSDIGGTGLGLSIVKHIIEAHHQKINLRSTLNIGTTFAFTLEAD